MDDLLHSDLQGYLMGEETSKLECSVDMTGWYIPEEITLQDNNLVWNLLPQDGEAGRELKKVRAKPGLILNFSRLYKAEDNTILNFARKWGVLCLCEHGLPAWDVGDKCLPLGDHASFNDNQCEPIAIWRMYSSEAHRILAKAAKIYRETEETQDSKGRHEIWNKQVLLAKKVQWWIDQAGVKIEYLWSYDKQRIAFGTPSLFAALSVQLMSMVSKRGLAICSNCGEIYMASRIPRRDQRNYCDKEECKKLAAWRDSKKDQRRKRGGKYNAIDRCQKETLPEEVHAEKTAGSNKV